MIPLKRITSSASAHPNLCHCDVKDNGDGAGCWITFARAQARSQLQHVTVGETALAAKLASTTVVTRPVFLLGSA